MQITHIKNHAHKWRDFIIDIIYPKNCLKCNKEKTYLCNECFKAIEINKRQECFNCRNVNLIGKFTCDCIKNYYFNNLFIALNYKDKTVSSIIKKYKYNLIKELSAPLSCLLEKYINESILDNKEFLDNFFLKHLENKSLIVIPIPLHKKRLRWRGFNQSELIAKNLSEKFNLNTTTALKKIKYRKPQTKLTKIERRKNIENSFIWTGENLKGKNILLIDDVITSGSTLNECSKILKENDAGKIYGLVLAKN